MRAKNNRVGVMVRLPDDLHKFLRAEAQKNGSSLNSEVVRSVRERMDRIAVETQP